MKRSVVIFLFLVSYIVAQKYALQRIPDELGKGITFHWNNNLIDTINTFTNDTYESGGIGDEIVYLDYNFDGYKDFYFFNLSNLGQGVCDYYLFIFDPQTSTFIKPQSHIGEAHGLVSIIHNNDSSFSEIYYFDYLSCHDTITHYKDTIIEKINCDFDAMDY